MSKVRFKHDTTNSFFGNFLYEQVLPQDHFLVRLRHEVPWEYLARPLLQAYKGGGEYGPPPYPPEKILRMLLIAYLFNISEREAETVVQFNLLAKYFVGLGVDELPPDHSTLTIFKDRLLKYRGKRSWEKLFTHTISLAKKKGIQFGSLQIIDSTHTIADVNSRKDQERTREGKPPRDPRASWKTKGEKQATTKAGKRIRVKDQFYGYKSHASFNQESQLVTSLVVTTGKADDGKQLPRLVKKDVAIGVSRGITDLFATPNPADTTTYTADKAYDDGDNHEFLASRRLVSAIILKTTRLTKKDAHKHPWEQMVASPHYQKAIKLRKAIEKKFGEAKKHHGLVTCRYLGLAKYAIQAYLTVMVVNLKRIMLLTNPTTMAPAILPVPG